MSRRFLSFCSRPAMAVAMLVMLAAPALDIGAAVGEENGEATPAEAPTTVTYQNPADLAELINSVCDGARERFHGFYGPRVIWVESFSTVGRDEQNRRSELGVTLADQMTAVINNDTLATRGKASGSVTQRLTGELQELDGYLRIHMSGVNAAGERASYVVNVEMSEPIYRALHTYL